MRSKVISKSSLQLVFVWHDFIPLHTSGGNLVSGPQTLSPFLFHIRLCRGALSGGRLDYFPPRACVSRKVVCGPETSGNWCKIVPYI